MAHTTSMGQKWDRIRESANFEILEAISFPDSIHGWMVGNKPGENRAYILHSDDKGETWSEQTSSVSDQLKDVHFNDSLEGFVLGVNSIQKTIDGGDNWVEIELGALSDNPLFVGFDFENETAWAVGDGGILIKSTDGGDTWSEKNPVSSDAIIAAIDFSNPDTGVAVGQIGTDHFATLTTDGGESWSPLDIASEIGGAFFDVAFADQSTVYAVGRGGFVVRSDDAGVTWQEMTRIQSIVTYLLNTSVYFTDAKRGWVASVHQSTSAMMYIHRTDDGGVTWIREIQSTLKSPKVGVTDILFSENGTGWACGWRSSGTSNGDFILERDALGKPPPEAICKNGSVYLDAAGEVTLTVSDVDGGTDPTFIDTAYVTPENFYCFQAGDQNALLYVIDDEGNLSTCESTISVWDTLQPIAIGKDITLVLDPDTDYTSISGADVDDGSSDNCEIDTMTVSPWYFTSVDIGVQTVTLTVTDIHGNTSTTNANVTVESGTTSLSPDQTSYSKVSFLGNHPNPFNTSTSIMLNVAESVEIQLNVYSSAGQLIEHLFEGEISPGVHSFDFESPSSESGLYICVLQVNGRTSSRKMIKSR